MLIIPQKGLRTLLRIVLPWILIPLVVLLGGILLSQKQYWMVILAVALLSLLLFAAGFEKKSVGSRRMVIAAIMIALCVVGRLIPFFKPVTAITVIAALYLGGEAGFLVGSLSALLSNFTFGQGPWTPFQMLAWGLIGLLAGLLSKPLRNSRILLLAYGVLSGIFFSLIMDVWVLLGSGDGIGWALYLAAVTTSIPHTILYALSNFIFLWFMAKPFSEKLSRIQIKYGI